MATTIEPTSRSRSRPTTTTPTPTNPVSSHSAKSHSPSPSPARTTPRPPRSENQSPNPNRRSVGSASVFSAKNKLRKTHPLAAAPQTLHNDNDKEGYPAGGKSLLESGSSSASSAASPRASPPVHPTTTTDPSHPHPHPTSSTNTLLADEAARIVRRASPGYAIARPNSSMSLLKPTATKAQKVRGLRGASRAVRMKIIRAFGRIFSSKSGRKQQGKGKGDAEKEGGFFVRLFVPRSFLERNRSRGVGKVGLEREKGKGKDKRRADRREEVPTPSPDGRKDSKLALDSPNGSFTAARNIRARRDASSESIILHPAASGNPESPSSPRKGILRLRLKKEKEKDEGGSRSPILLNGHAATSTGKPEGAIMLVEDPVWAARKKSSIRDLQTPPRTPNREREGDRPGSSGGGKGKFRNSNSNKHHEGAPASKSLITAYESGAGSGAGFILQDHDQQQPNGNGTNKPAHPQGKSWFRENQKETPLQQLPPNGIIPTPTPPPPIRTPPNEIGLALTTDDVSIISAISRKSSTLTTNGNYLLPLPLPPHHSPGYYTGDSDSDADDTGQLDRRTSWRIPNNLHLGGDEPIRRSQNNPINGGGDSPASVHTILRAHNYNHNHYQHNNRNRNSVSPSRSTTVITPTRVVTSPHTRLRRSSALSERPGGEEELVEFNVLVRPGDRLYDILVEQELQSQGQGQGMYGGGGGGGGMFGMGEVEVESEIEYFTADENESADVSEAEGGGGGDDGDGDNDNDNDSVASGTGTIRAVEIASEGGTMRGVEIVGKRRKGEGDEAGVAGGGGGGGGGWGFADVLVGSRR